MCLGLSMGQCVLSSSGCRENDKALCAVPTPRKLLAALLLPFLLPLPSSQQCTIDSSFQLSAKASRNWIMKWSCGKKKIKTERQFSRKAAKDTSQFHFLWHTQKSKHPTPFSCCLHIPGPDLHTSSIPPKSGSVHATTIPPQD